jgi:hypothetical protein
MGTSEYHATRYECEGVLLTLYRRNLDEPFADDFVDPNLFDPGYTLAASTGLAKVLREEAALAQWFDRNGFNQRQHPLSRPGLDGVQHDYKASYHTALPFHPQSQCPILLNPCLLFCLRDMMGHCNPHDPLIQSCDPLGIAKPRICAATARFKSQKL